MKLTKKLATVALGAAVLTAVPLAAFPVTAYACADTQTSCDDYGDGSLDPGNWYDGEYVEGVGDWDAPSTPVVTLPEIVVIGYPAPPEPPPAQLPPSFNFILPAAGGSSSSGPEVTVLDRGQKQEGRTDCLRNDSPAPVKLTQNVSYTVSYRVNSSISASARSILSATIGVQLDTTLTRTQGVEVTLNPGQSWALYIEFQTVTYRIVEDDIFGNPQPPEYAQVVQPTGLATARTC